MESRVQHGRAVGAVVRWGRVALRGALVEAVVAPAGQDVQVVVPDLLGSPEPLCWRVETPSHR